MELCHETAHGISPIYKVVIHSKHGNTLYVFVGSKPPQTQILKKISKGTHLSKEDETAMHSAYGRHWRSKLGTDLHHRIIFIETNIYDDDNLATIRNKIGNACGVDSSHVYMWCNKVLRNKDDYWDTVFEEWAYDKKLVSGAQLKGFIGSLTGDPQNQDPFIETKKHSVNKRIIVRKAKQNGGNGVYLNDDETMSVSEASHFIKSTVKASFVNIPLGFRYMQRGRMVFFPVHPGAGSLTHDVHENLILVDDSYKHIEYFAPYKRVLHVILKNDMPDNDAKHLYYPSGIGARKSAVGEIYGRAIETSFKEVTGKYKNTCFVGYAQLRNIVGISFEQSVFNIDRMFDDVELSPNGIVFVKKITRNSGSMVKMVNSMLISQSNKTDILKWSKMEVFKRGVLCDALIIKIQMGNSFGEPLTLVMLANGTCDLKVRLGLSKSSIGIDGLIRALKAANKVISTICDASNIKPLLFDTNVFQVGAGETSTRIINLTIGSALKTTDKIVDISKIENAYYSNKNINNAFAFLGTDNGTMEFVYRHVNDFGCDFQVQSYIARSNALLGKASAEEMVTRLMTLFNMDKDEAISALKDWKSRYSEHAIRLGISKGRSAKGRITQALYGSLVPQQLLKVRLKPAASGYRLVMDGLTHVLYYKRVMRLIKVLLSDATSVKKSKKISQPAKVELTNTEDVIINTKVNADEPFVQINEELMGDINEDLMKEVNDFLKGLENDTETNIKEEQSKTDNAEDSDDENTKPTSKKQVKKGDPYKNYLITELKSADRVLFTVKGEGFETYARVCQSKMMRQPVVISTNEKTRIDSKFPGSYNGALDYRNHVYICPDVWCPKSRLSMTRTQFEANGKKCPDNNEKPLTFFQKSDVNTNTRHKQRYIGFFGPEKHNQGLCMPCCYFTKQKLDKQCGVDDQDGKGNIRYIKGEGGPVGEGRYGLLPVVLSEFLGNKKMGNRANGSGLMQKNTDAFFRYGVSIRKQSFLYAMSQVLGMRNLDSEHKIIESISNNIDILTVMSLYNGYLFKKFLSMVNTKAIFDNGSFTEFKGWFIQNKTYVDTFDIEHLRKVVVATTTFHPNIPYARQIWREFMFWSAYKTFINDYLQNDDIIKTHEFLLDLFNMNLDWLNGLGINIIVLETDLNGDVFIPCSQASNIRPMKDIVLIAKSGQFYEPVHHVKMEASGSIISTSRFNKENFDSINKLFKFIIGGKVCKQSLAVKQRAVEIGNAIKGIGETIGYYVIDYDFRIVGVVIRVKDGKGLLIPLTKPYSLSNFGNAKFTFLDDALTQHIRVFKDEEVRKIVTTLNKGLGDNTIQLSKTKTIMKGFDVILIEGKKPVIDFIPLSALPSTIDSDTTIMKNLNDDLDMILRYEQSDPRTMLIEHNKVVDSLKNSLWNEIIGYLKRKPDVFDHVIFLRNPLNPIPKMNKVSILHAKLSKFIDMVTRKPTIIVPKSKMLMRNDPNELSGISVFHNKVCSTIGKQNECDGQCTWIVKVANGKQLGGKCILSIPATVYNVVISRILLDILNVNVALKQKAVVSKLANEDGIVVFTDSDIRNGKLDKLFEDNNGVDEWGFKRKDSVIKDSELFLNTTAFINDDTHNMKLNKNLRALPTGLRDKLKGAMVNVEEHYDQNTLYAYFAKIYNIVQASGNSGIDFVNAAQVKDMVKQRILADFNSNTSHTNKLLTYNPSLEKFYKKHASPTAQEVANALNEPTYYPSDYDVRILADICHVNIFVWGRKTARNPDNNWCLGKYDDALYTICMEQSFDRSKKIDVYEFIVDTKKQAFLFETNTMPKHIRQKCTRVTIME